MVVKNGHESYGRIRKKSPEKKTQDTGCLKKKRQGPTKISL